MITDPTGRIALSALGWVDHGSLWRVRTPGPTIDAVELGDADYLRLHSGRGDHFAVQHHWNTGRFRVTAHSFHSPGRIIASVEVDGPTPRCSGDMSVWSSLPRAFVGFLDGDATGSAGYFVVEVASESARVQRLDWFDDGTYDQDYQGIVSVLELSPGVLVYGVQRSSELVVCDSSSSGGPRKVPLAGRGGNPRPVCSQSGARLWVIDYDTIVRLNCSTLSVERRKRLDMAPAGTAMFVGEPWLSPDESYLVVPRPGRGDVVMVDARSLRVRKRIVAGTEPLEAAVVGEVLVGREWKTGAPFVTSVDGPGGRRRRFGRRG